ncbi:TPA: sensor histidine kinase, partial [Klebsiella pneumoniae]
MKKNFFIILVALLLLIAFTVSSVVKYNSLLSEKTLYTVASTQENYGFSVAKFIIQLNELYTLINSDNTIDDVRLKFDILYSRLNVIYVRSEATAPLYKQQGYEETIDSINKKLEDIDGLLSHNHPDYKKISTIIADIKPLTKTVTNLADMAEIAQRNDALKDFRSKRQQLWTLLFITGGLISLLLFVLFIYISKINRLLLSERAAFASKNAFLGMVGHELRTSLQAIVSIIDVVTNNLSGGIKSGQIERLETAVSKMERQLNDLAEFAKIDNGSVEIKNTYNSLQAIVTNAVQDCIAIYEKKDVTVKIKNNNDA